MSLITILTVNWYSLSYIEKLFQNLYDKSLNKNNLKFLIIDNTNGKDSDILSLKQQFTNLDIIPLDIKGLKGSNAHAYALNYVKDLIQTEYTLIIDPDIYVFFNEWDNYSINQLNEKDIISIGAPFPPWKLGKFHNFPSAPFCFFKTDIIKNFLWDFTPYSNTIFKNIYNMIIRTITRLFGLINRKTYENSNIVRRYCTFIESIFGIYSEDTGWKIAYKALKNKKKSLIFKTVLQHETHLAPKSKLDVFKELAKEYELYYTDNLPFMTHKYGATLGPLWRTEKGNDVDYWRKCIKKFEE